jgi:hypothetical protein
VLAHPVFQRGEVTTSFIEREFATWQPDASDKLQLALIAAALGDARSTPVLPTTNCQPPTTNSDPWQVGDGFRIGG